METVRWEQLISDEQWDNEARSAIDLEMSRDRLSKDAVIRCNKDPIKESRVIPHPDVGRAVPRTEASLTLILAKKNRRINVQKRVWTDYTRFSHPVPL